MALKLASKQNHSWLPVSALGDTSKGPLEYGPIIIRSEFPVLPDSLFVTRYDNSRCIKIYHYIHGILYNITENMPHVRGAWVGFLCDIGQFNMIFFSKQKIYICILVNL